MLFRSEQAEQEVEMGNSAVHMAAAGGKIAPFFRFPELQHLPQLLPYLAERNIATFSTDIDSRDFRMHKPDQVVKSVMSQLEKHGKGIILMHDLHRNTAEALPELIRQCTWCRRVSSPRCRNTTRWSRIRASCRRTIPAGLKTSSSTLLGDQYRDQSLSMRGTGPGLIRLDGRQHTTTRERASVQIKSSLPNIGESFFQFAR